MSARKSSTSWRDRRRQVQLPAEHVYVRNGIPTRDGGPEGCASCNLAAKHEIHIDPPETPEEARRVTDRILGEGSPDVPR